MTRSAGSRVGAGDGPGTSPSRSAPAQAKNYMKGLPELEKKDFASVLTNASPLGRWHWGGRGSWAWDAALGWPDLPSPQP